MRIGFDAKRLFLNNTGLGNYSRTLVKNLVLNYPDHTYFLFTPKSQKSVATQFFFDHPSITIIEPNTSFSAFWRSFGIKKQIAQHKLDVFHGLSNELPFGADKMACRKVVTIHDVIFDRYPKHYPFFDRLIYKLKTKSAVKTADKIIGISNQTLSDLQVLYKANSSKLNLLYQSCNMSTLEVDPLNKVGEYFLYVGSVIERKNLLRVVQALKEIPINQRRKLVVIGSGQSYQEEVKSFIEVHKLQAWVEWKGSLSNEELLNWYSKCIALVYPSIYEGFGIPVIEAMYLKRPVITSNLSSLKEAGGEAAILVDPFNVTEIANAMIEIQDIEKQNELLAKMPKHLAQFNPQKLSLDLIDLYTS